jgi:hypothetical protein
MAKRRIGFSTGAISKGDFLTALELLHKTRIRIVELSALRFYELESLVDAIPSLELDRYDFVSVHAPSSFSQTNESFVVRLLKRVTGFGLPVIVHPDVIYNPAAWTIFGDLLYIENMDQRKSTGRTTRELSKIFTLLPLAKLCFDAGHARNVDTTMSQAAAILEMFKARLGQVHLSTVSSLGRHESFIFSSMHAFREIAHLIPEDIPVILESPVSSEQIENEAALAEMVLSKEPPVPSRPEILPIR